MMERNGNDAIETMQIPKEWFVEGPERTVYLAGPPKRAPRQKLIRFG